MRFLLDGLQKQATVNGVTYPVNSPVLSAGVDFVSWADLGVGSVQKSVEGFRDTFTDPSPYQGFINAWITAGGTSNVLLLTLAQAKTIKADFVTAIEVARRQLPVSVTVGGVSRQWDGSDAAVANYALLSGGAQAVTVGTAVAAAATAAINALTPPGGGLGGGGGGLADPVPPPTLPNVNVVPYLGAAAVSVTVADLKLITDAINARRSAVAIAKQTKLTAIAALSTISTVAGYDATSGWPA